MTEDDPHGYRIEYEKSGGFRVVRIADDSVIGVYDTRAEAVAAAEADPASP